MAQAEEQHEEALIRAFVRTERQPRLLSLLGSPKGRAKLRAALPHFSDLDPRYARRVPPAEQQAGAIEALLRRLGAPALCQLLAEDAQLDGREMPLAEALGAVVGRGMGAFISCLPGRLAYFEAEDAGERYVLHRAV
jgi:hypothetical protein